MNFYYSLNSFILLDTIQYPMNFGERPLQDWTRIILRRIVLLAAPLVIYILLIGIFWFTYPPETGLFGSPNQQFVILIGLLAAYLVPPLGKESIIPIALGLGYPAWVVASGVILMDMVTAMFIACNFDLLEKIPVVGGLIQKVMNTAAATRKSQPWIEQLSHIGLFIFMFIPLQGSGAMNTTILGRLLGMPPRVVYLIVTAGSILSTLTIIFGVTAILELWQTNPHYAILLIAVIVVVILILVILWRRYTAKFGKKET